MERPRGQDQPAGASPAAGPAGAAPGTGGKLLASGYQGAVYLVETETGRVIVKRAMGGALARAARRAMLRREHDIYRLLEGVQGIPRCYGLREGGELVLQFVDGPSLRAARLDAEEREQFFAALLRLIESMHRARVAHGDLKRKDNLLVGPGGQPFLIDFGTAVSAPPGAGPLRRLLFRQLRRMDLNAWFKLKYQGRRGEVTPGDLARFRPTLAERVARVVRRAWRTVTLRRRRRARRSRRR
jgi:predicted Ser/Thr protein kinase